MAQQKVAQIIFYIMNYVHDSKKQGFTIQGN